MKRNWKKAVLGGTALALLVGTMGISSLALEGYHTRSVHYNNYQVSLNGQPVDMRDGNGNSIEPFIMNGTTYLPVAVLSRALGVDVRWDAAGQTLILTSKGQQPVEGQYIGEAKAKEIALNHAGLSAAQVTFYRTVLEYDNGRAEYEVEFWKGNTEYDYEIDAVSGAILSYDYDIEGYLPSGGQSSGDIGAEKAKTIALNHAGVSASDAVFVRAHLDYENGRRVYDVEFYSGSREYDYEIDAATGNILSYDYDADHYNPSSGGQSSGDIGAEKAKTIALNHAGVSASDAVFVRAHLDYENGRRVYDVEFYSGSTEYDYEIDAATGDVLSYDYDAEYYAPQTSTGDYITEARVKQIVEERAGVSGTFYGLRLERDDGRMVYEGEMRNGWTEYEFTVDAVTGTILEWDVDRG